MVAAATMITSKSVAAAVILFILTHLTRLTFSSPKIEERPAHATTATAEAIVG